MDYSPETGCKNSSVQKLQLQSEHYNFKSAHPHQQQTKNLAAQKKSEKVFLN